MPEKAAAFTGHRDVPQQEIKRLSSQLVETVRKLYDEGITVFYSGGAVGFDLLAAEAVLFLRSILPIKLVMAIPFPGQADRYSARDRERYDEVLARADEVITLCGFYMSDVYHIRNRYMVDNSEAVVAYITHSGGGTAYTVEYAREKKKKIISLGVNNQPV